MRHQTHHTPIYGLVAEFETPEALLNAARQTREAGYVALDAYTPFPVDGLSEALKLPPSPLPLIVLIGGLIGAAGGFFLQTYGMVFDYSYLVAGRPYFSWPAFIPITFESTILVAALAATFGMLMLNRLPRPHHPVFNTPHFRRASVDGFFLCIMARDPQFDRTATRALLKSLHPHYIFEITE